MRAFLRTSLVLAAVVVLLAGCVRPSMTTPAPTFQCTGADPDAPRTPCSQEEYEAQQQTHALEREAMIVYEKYWAEMVKLMEEGAPADAALRLSPYLDDPILGVEVSILNDQREDGLQPSHVKHSLTMWPAPAEALEGSLVTIVGCEDTRGSTFLWSTREPTDGVLLRTARHFKRVEGGRLKNYDITERVVEQCDK